MADFFNVRCLFCGDCCFYRVEGSDTDAEKAARIYCYKCESTNVRTEPMDDAFYKRYPDMPRLREDAPMYPFTPPPESLS